MRLLARLLLQFAANAAALASAPRIIEGIAVEQELKTLLSLALLLTVLMVALRPLFKCVTLPLLIMTLGIFSLVINGAVLAILDFFSPSITILNVRALSLLTLLVSFAQGTAAYIARRARHP